MNIYSKFQAWLKVQNKFLFAAYIILLLLGLTMSFSLSYTISRKLGTASFFFFLKQFFFCIIGIAIVIFFSNLSFGRILDICIIMLPIAILLIFLTLFLKTDVKGASRWIDLGLFKIQPSEVVRPFLLVVNGFLLFEFQKTKNKRYIYVIMVILGLICAMFLLQPDFGSVATMMILFSSQIFFTNFKLRNMFVLCGVTIIVCIIAFFTLSHVRHRIMNFLDTKKGDNYQTGLAIKAIKNGGFFGLGLGNSVYKYKIPDSHNDFLFSVIGEELGYLGYLIITLLFMFICFNIVYFITLEKQLLYDYMFTEKLVESMHLYAIILLPLVFSIFFGFFVNACVNLSLAPTKGMALPFISYGGSSMISNSITMGIIMSFTKKRSAIMCKIS